MSKRFILTKVSTGENDGFEQDVALVLANEAQVAALLARLARSKRIKAEEDTNLYAVEYWTSAVHFVQHDELADLIVEHHEEAERVAALLDSFYAGDDEVLCVEDPEQVVLAVIDDYEVDGETRLNCVTVVVTDDTVVYTALAKHGDGKIESKTLGEEHVRWLAGELAQAPA